MMASEKSTVRLKNPSKICQQPLEQGWIAPVTFRHWKVQRKPSPKKNTEQQQRPVMSATTPAENKQLLMVMTGHHYMGVALKKAM